MNDRSRPRPWPRLLLALAVGALAPLMARSQPAPETRLDGFNVIAALGHPFGSDSANASLAEAKRLGARAIAVIPFLWQPTPSSPDLSRGNDMTDTDLRAAIRDAHALGLAVLLKPHVWVPQSWAGAVAMRSEEDWQTWFANYRRELDRIAWICAEEKADALAIGTELVGTSERPEWASLIGTARNAYLGRLMYVAHNPEEAETVAFWDQLDAIGVTLYPPLGADDDRDGRLSVMRRTADRLDALAARTARPVVVGEVGLRSAVGAAAKPWESVEERSSAPAPALQAEVLADWLAILDRPSIRGIFIWEWLTNPNAGGPTDTDFTVQGKPSEHVLACAWTHDCKQDHAGIEMP